MAMSSLTPGVLFKSSGLNQNHTPTGITSSSEQVKTKYRRSSIPERKWPPESPVAQVYDIRNSSSRLIILNNRMEKKSHLRVQSGRYKPSPDNSEDEKNTGIEPERHFRESPTTHRRHADCHNSSSPRFQPMPSRPATSESPRNSSRHRYTQEDEGPARPSDWHHYSSQIDRYRAYTAPPRRSKSLGRKAGIEPPPCFKRDKAWLQHPDMSYGQKKYMNSIACTYDITDMKQLKQAQYIQLIYREQQRAKRFFTPENYKKYLIYLNSDRVRQFNTQPPPKTLTKVNNDSNKKQRHKSRRSREEKSTEDESRQSAPKPVHQRRTTTPRDESEERRAEARRGDRSGAVSRQAKDDTEYMMYSDPENPPKKEKTTTKRGKTTSKQEKTITEEEEKTPKQDETTTKQSSSRPKSSKYRSRSQSGGKTPQHKPITSSDESESESSKRHTINGSKGSKSEGAYWTQPAPPVQEVEPDGTGLTMTKDRDLDKEGETLEDISSNHGDDNHKTKATGKGKTGDRESRRSVTYDIEDGDGAKTRVYADTEPSSKQSHSDETPVIREENSTTEPRTESGPDQTDSIRRIDDRRELQEALDSKRRTQESNAESKHGHQSSESREDSQH